MASGAVPVKMSAAYAGLPALIVQPRVEIVACRSRIDLRIYAAQAKHSYLLNRAAVGAG